MSRRALASAFNMEGGFNDVSLAARDGTRPNAEVHRAGSIALLEPYGGLGAVPQRLQVSAWTLENELAQLQMFGFITPLIFLGVAAFILNVALTRALALQRPQIAALKALGLLEPRDWLALHQVGARHRRGRRAGRRRRRRVARLGDDRALQRVLPISGPRLPALRRRGRASLVLAASLVAALGAQSAVRRAVRIPPAEAMRPEAPARYRASIFERAWRRVR